MVYKFLALADLHWGAMDSKLTYDNLKQVLEFIKEMKNEIDFIVICGDYFDYRIQLNSKTTLLAVKWFDELISTCKECGVKKVRMIKGTQDHDNEQLEVFRHPYETVDNYFKLYNTATAENLFEDLRVIFCPDELINAKDHIWTYIDLYRPDADMGFFHGNFDTVLPSIEQDRIREHNLQIMVYNYTFLSRAIKGPLIAGHWHVAQDYDPQYYVGSYDRWCFGEEEPKGFIYGAYDTETSKYYIHRVENKLARVFKTLVVSDEDCKYPADFAMLADKIRGELVNDPNMKLRVLYIISTDDEDEKKTFNIFHQQFANNHQVKIDTKDLVKRDEKKNKKKKVEIESRQYDYVFNGDIGAIPSIIKKFIMDKRGEDIPLETVEKYVKKYIDI